MDPVKGNGRTKRVFVTVGTTLFDDLISHALQPDTLQVLEARGYTHIKLQVGRGAEPVIPASTNINISWYRLKESIISDFEESSLVISHAGAGSCLEALGANKPLVVVINEKLMGNHQLELAEKLHSEGHAVMCFPQTLLTTLQEMEPSELKPFPKVDGSKFSNYLNELMGLV
nr:EOG090X0KOU [Ilyocryptus agilis]